MKTVVNETVIEYKALGWIPLRKGVSLDKYVCSIDIDVVTFCPPSGSSIQFFSENLPSTRLSSLRGKVTKYDEAEIDQQISILRGEWERDI